ncbi:MAG: hypothetical protein ABIQ15_02880 [Nocardioides sp.]
MGAVHQGPQVLETAPHQGVLREYGGEALSHRHALPDSQINRAIRAEKTGFRDTAHLEDADRRAGLDPGALGRASTRADRAR